VDGAGALVCKSSPVQAEEIHQFGMAEDELEGLDAGAVSFGSIHFELLRTSQRRTLEQVLECSARFSGSLSQASWCPRSQGASPNAH